METRDIVNALRARWWMLVAGLVLGGASGLGATSAMTPQYTSTIQFFVSTTGSTSTSEVLQGGQFSQARIASYAELLQGDQLAQRVIDRADLDMTSEELTAHVTVEAVPETVLLDVAVADPSAARALAIADAFGTEFTDMVAGLESSDVAGGTAVRVTVADPPELAIEPSSPDPLENVGIGLLGGLVLGAGIAVLRARLDRTVKNENDTTAVTDVPVVGVTLRDPGATKDLRAGDAVVTEDYRRLRVNFQFLDVDSPPRVVMVSSAQASEGKSTLTVGLAMALAEVGNRVVIVDADLRRPRVAQILGLVEDVGLTNVLAGGADLEDVIQASPTSSVAVLGAGPTPPNPGRLLVSENMRALIEKLRAEFDVVLVDAPPVLPVADAAQIATVVDGSLVVVRYGSTRTDHLEQAVGALEQVGGAPLGLVITMVPRGADLANARGLATRYGYAATT